jgi:diguanylate cyclase (GGDEF)-like protein/PAS domain S-box-containing protein
MQNKILILTDDSIDAAILKAALENTEDGDFETKWARRLSTAKELLHLGDIDAVIVDLLLPDSSGIATFDQLFDTIPHIPIMTLCEEDEEELAILTVKHGAQGYLSKGHFASNLVSLTLRNVIQRKQIEQKLYQEKVRAEITLNSIGDAVLCTDMNGNINYLNIAAEKMTGWVRDDAYGLPISEVFKIINGVTRKHDQNPVEMVLQNNQPRGLNPDTILIRRDGSEVPIEDSASPIHDGHGNLTGAVVVFHDVSAVQAMTVKMAYLAQHDFLTNLPNRVLLNDRIAQAITLAKRGNTKLEVLFLDLDKFKHINDSLGHETGDKLLQSVAQRLNECVRSSDTVSRQGGDEFVILLTGGKDGIDTTLIADKILTSLSLPHTVGTHQLHITTSIGISIYPEDGDDPESLIDNADIAMYNAKENGRNNYQFFSIEMHTRAVERQMIEANLRIALENQEFVLLFQPKIDLVKGHIVGAEALLRWAHPDLGMLSPNRFIAIAEDTGLIIPLGNWVLKEACAQAKKWLKAGLQPLSIAVNISALEFRQHDFVEGVNNILIDEGLDGHMLQLEITESVLMHDIESNIKKLSALKNMGVQLAVDDFGTGFSSLSYLKQFPLDVIKIDQSFLCDIESTTDNGTIANAVIAMGKSLKLKLVAEGVENTTQLAFLRKFECEEGQGYLFSKPLNAEQFTSLLEKNNSTLSSNIPEGADFALTSSYS